MANALSVLVATIIIGSNYTQDFLENPLARSLSKLAKTAESIVTKRNVVEAGIIPVSIGFVCIVLFLTADTILQSKPPDNVLIEILLIILQIGIFSFISYGLWRLGVNEYERRKEKYMVK